MYRPPRALAGLLAAALVAASCATRNIPPMGAGGTAFSPEADERKLWTQAETEEENLLKRVAAYDDPSLEEYLGRLGEKLIPNEVRAAGGPGFRFVVLRDPTLNVFAMPNGRIFIHTGLLSRVDNEAQLATVVGHEMTHVYHRHALKFTRDAQSKLHSVMSAAASLGTTPAAGSRTKADDYVGTAVLSQSANAILGLGLQLATVAAINGYGGDLERDADESGLQQLVKAGYDPKEAMKVFKLLKEDGSDRGALETFFFGNHPRLQERIDTIQQLLRVRYAEEAKRTDTVKTTEDFALRMRTVVRENAQLDVRAGRFALARKQLDRVLKITPSDPIAHLYYGDLHRLQSQRAKAGAEKDAEAQKALESYEQSAALDPSYPDPFRQLGLLYYQQKDSTRAKAAFEKYLALKPDASDARRVREYLLELGR